MSGFALRPDKKYSPSELSRILGLAPYDLFILIEQSGLIFDYVDDQAVFTGSDIQTIIESAQCTTQATSRFIGTS